MSIPVPYHEQETSNFCGAACLKMVVEALGHKAGSQTTLFNQSEEHGVLDPQSDWAGPPDGLEWVLQDKGEIARSAAEVLSPTGETALTRKIIWSISKHKVPPIVLIWGWIHWVVVVDYDIDHGPPTGPGDTSYTINGVMIHDPGPDIGEDRPPPP